MANKNNNKTNNQSVNNQSANSLQYVTYTSPNTGKTIPVVIGFTGKDDERLPYIAYVAEVKSEKGKVKNGKGKKAKKLHGPAYATYSVLPLGKDGERIPCAIWGADPRWHDIAKRAAEIISDPYSLKQEDYDDLCAKAEAVYEAKKSEGSPFPTSPKGAEGEQPAKVQPKGKKAPKPTKPTEATTKATKPADDFGKTITEAALMAAFEQVAKASKLSKENKGVLENFLKAIIAKAA